MPTIKIGEHANGAIARPNLNNVSVATRIVALQLHIAAGIFGVIRHLGGPPLKSEEEAYSHG